MPNPTSLRPEGLPAPRLGLMLESSGEWTDCPETQTSADLQIGESRRTHADLAREIAAALGEVAP
jgi:hypothetical protein